MNENSFIYIILVEEPILTRDLVKL